MLRAAAAFVGETAHRAKTEVQLAKPPRDDDGEDDDDDDGEDDDDKGGPDDGDHVNNDDGNDGTVKMDLGPRAAQKLTATHQIMMMTKMVMIMIMDMILRLVITIMMWMMMSCLRMVIARPRIAQEPEELQLSKPPQEMIIALTCMYYRGHCVCSFVNFLDWLRCRHSWHGF